MNTLFDKIWDAHVVQHVDGGPDQLYVDQLYCHEVTSPQAFDGLRARSLRPLRPERCGRPAARVGACARNARGTGERPARAGPQLHGGSREGGSPLLRRQLRQPREVLLLL